MGVRSFLLLVLALMVTVNCLLLAQTETATLSGYVTDPDGKVLAHADVRVVNVRPTLHEPRRRTMRACTYSPISTRASIAFPSKALGLKSMSSKTLYCTYKMQLQRISKCRSDRYPSP